MREQLGSDVASSSSTSLSILHLITDLPSSSYPQHPLTSLWLTLLHRLNSIKSVRDFNRFNRPSSLLLLFFSFPLSFCDDGCLTFFNVLVYHLASLVVNASFDIWDSVSARPRQRRKTFSTSVILKDMKQSLCQS